MDKLDKLKKVLEIASRDTITIQQAKELVDLLVSITNKQKQELVNKSNEFADKVSQETMSKINEAISILNEKANDNQLEVRQLTNKQKKAHEAEMSELRGLIEEFRDFEPEEVDTEAIINETLSRIPKVELPEEIGGEDIVDKINTLNLNPENQIDAKHIKNLPIGKGVGGSTARNLYQLQDVNITEPTNAQVLTYDASNNTWKNADSTGGGGTWGTITGTLSDQTDLQSALDAKQDDITTGTTAQYFRGDLSLATFPTALSDFSNDSGFITGNQTITLSGDITGSGTTGITTTIASGAVDIAMLSATGTPSSSTYLRGDNTWATVSGGMSEAQALAFISLGVLV